MVNDNELICVFSIAGHGVANVSSLHFYSGTKFAVTALIEGLRKELRDLKSNIKISVSSYRL